MNQKIILDQISNIIYAQRNKHLSNVEYLLLKGCLNHQTYLEISFKINYTENYLAEIGGKLFKDIGSCFRVKVTKNNFLWFCETYLAESVVNFF